MFLSAVLEKLSRDIVQISGQIAQGHPAVELCTNLNVLLNTKFDETDSHRGADDFGILRVVTMSYAQKIEAYLATLTSQNASPQLIDQNRFIFARLVPFYLLSLMQRLVDRCYLSMGSADLTESVFCQPKIVCLSFAADNRAGRLCGEQRSVFYAANEHSKFKQDYKAIMPRLTVMQRSIFDKLSSETVDIRGKVPLCADDLLQLSRSAHLFQGFLELNISVFNMLRSHFEQPNAKGTWAHSLTQIVSQLSANRQSITAARPKMQEILNAATSISEFNNRDQSAWGEKSINELLFDLINRMCGELKTTISQLCASQIRKKAPSFSFEQRLMLGALFALYNYIVHMPDGNPFAHSLQIQQLSRDLLSHLTSLTPDDFCLQPADIETLHTMLTTSQVTLPECCLSQSIGFRSDPRVELQWIMPNLPAEQQSMMIRLSPHSSRGRGRGAGGAERGHETVQPRERGRDHVSRGSSAKIKGDGGATAQPFAASEQGHDVVGPATGGVTVVNTTIQDAVAEGTPRDLGQINGRRVVSATNNDSTKKENNEGCCAGFWCCGSGSGSDSDGAAEDHAVHSLENDDSAKAASSGGGCNIL